MTGPVARADMNAMQASEPHVILIDNYDSFTWNLVHDFGALGARVEVVRNDARSAAEVASAKPDAIVLSPGPCTPREAGICLDLIRTAGDTTPILGVCLGHQAIGEAYGGRVVRAPVPVHGKVAEVTHGSDTLFRGFNAPVRATRYHSLVVDRATLPDSLDVTAETDGLIMALSHRSLPVHGVQFHPESIATEGGRRILRNFLDLAAAWRAKVGGGTGALAGAA